MVLSQASIYAVRAALYLATQEGRTFVPVRQVSAELGIPFHFLGKILSTLTNRKILASYRGPKGGIALGRSADSITLMEIVRPVERRNVFAQCILGLSGCCDDNPCPLHQEWGPLRDRITSMFERMTVAELARRIGECNLRVMDLVKTEKEEA